MYAIGDIHGCSRALEALLDFVGPPLGSTIVTLGDYVDRGIDSAGVMERLIRLSDTHRLIPLRGNHEEFMMDARKGVEYLELWKRLGGDDALIAYAPEELAPGLDVVPQSHWDFLDLTCRDLYETENHFFVHGGVDPDVPLVEQKLATLRWQSFPPARPHRSGKTMICGHTPQRSGMPLSVGHAICLDTNACNGGWLSCMDVELGEVWQANERGETRRSMLSLPRRR